MSKTSISEIIKFNGGNLAILCIDCEKILFTGVDFDPYEKSYVNNEDVMMKAHIKNILDFRVANRYSRYLCSECQNKKQHE